MGLVEKDHIYQQQQKHQEPIFKHFCRVCKRGFGCAGALGGHMRSHAVGDVRIHQPSHDQEIGMSNFMRGKTEGGTKHSYFLRTNTNRFTSTYRVSEGLLDNKRSLARPSIDVERGKFSSSLSSSESDEIEEMMMNKSTRAKSENYHQYQHCVSTEEEDLANCLVMLSNKSFVLSSDKEDENKAKQVEKCMFQCKACKKVFNSHQALGGHRASHKKVKGCYASKFNNNDHNEVGENIEEEEDLINQEEDDHDDHLVPSNYNSSESRLDLDFSPYHDQLQNTTNTTFSKRNKSIGHQCSICQRVFSSGQALGGHKRCHWLTSNIPENTIIRNLHDFQFDSQQLFKKPMLTKSEPPPSLDLNFPPLLNNAMENNLNMNSSTTNNPFNYEAPARIFLQLWGNEEVIDNKTANYQQQNYIKSVVHGSLHDLKSAKEDDCRMDNQIVKLSDLKDMNLDGGTSRWLQVGIASTTDIIATP
ncbi:hypothetical protein ACH5RR_038703 [Cinchona calisaya]|uniref:C2H2-type domain-containing protein n=1 Tax=Cinchona calisaya TaxID=153742 RepID=A0ABD2XZ35_9GENT